jgi:c-di-GMP-related signal transduction protein
VETADQVEILKNIGCQYVQGYYYSKPIESNEFIKKYCVEKENGKEYYDQLYASQAAARAQRNLSAAEAVTAQSASSAVEKFKKTYVPKNEEKSETVVDESGRLLSAEEQKILASEAKHGAETKLSEDAQ